MVITGGRRQRTRPEGAVASGRRCDHRRLRSPAAAPRPGTAPARLPCRGRGEPSVPGPAVRTMEGPQLRVGRKKRDPLVPTSVSPGPGITAHRPSLVPTDVSRLSPTGGPSRVEMSPPGHSSLLRRGADRAAVGGSALVQGVAVGLPAVPGQPAHRVVGSSGRRATPRPTGTPPIPARRPRRSARSLRASPTSAPFDCVPPTAR